jgi:hypothetical protein
MHADSAPQAVQAADKHLDAVIVGARHGVPLRKRDDVDFHCLGRATGPWKLLRMTDKKVSRKVAKCAKPAKQ